MRCSRQVCRQRIDGSIWAKGDNEYGQLGIEGTAKVDNYTKIMSGGVAGQQGF